MCSFSIFIQIYVAKMVFNDFPSRDVCMHSAQQTRQLKHKISSSMNCTLISLSMCKKYTKNAKLKQLKVCLLVKFRK